MTPRERVGLLLAVCAGVVSGAAIFLNGYGVRAVGDATVYTTGKNAVSALALLAVVATLHSTARPLLTPPAGPRPALGLLAVAVIGGSVPFVLFFEGLSRESSTSAAFLQKTLVVWVSLLAVPLLRERVGRLQVAAIALVVLGQAMTGTSLRGVLHMSFGSGELLILTATVMWAAEVVLVKRLLGSLPSWTVALARMALGSLLLLGWLAVHGRLGELWQLDANQWRWVAATGVVLAAYVSLWFAAVARARAVDVTAVLVVGAPITAALAALVQGVALQPQLPGLALTTLGVAVVLLGRLARRRAVAT